MSVTPCIVSRMVSHSISSDVQHPRSRPAKEAAADIGRMSLLFLILAGLFLTFPEGTNIAKLVERASTAGETVLDHIGWGQGVYISILLGFYIVVIGGQVVASPVEAEKTRRTLGAVAVAMTGAMTPAWLLIVVNCATEPQSSGALFVVLPAAAVTVFLAIQLAGFIVARRVLRIALARQQRYWAKNRLKRLKWRSRRPVGLVLAANVFVAVLSGAGTASLFQVPSEAAWILFMTHVVMASLMTAAGIQGVKAISTARDKMDAIAAWLLPSSLYLITVILAVGLFPQFGVAVVSSLLVILVCNLASTFWPRRPRPRFLLDWTVQGAGTALGAKWVAKTYARTNRQVEGLRKQPVLRSRDSIQNRLAVAFKVLRTVVSLR